MEGEWGGRERGREEGGRGGGDRQDSELKVKMSSE